MKLTFTAGVWSLALLLAAGEASAQNVLKYVNPNIGTAHSRWFFYTPAAVPYGMAKLMGRIAQRLPGAPLTADQVRMLQFDNVVSETAHAERRTLEGLGIEPTALDVVLPTYLARFRERGEFSQARPAA